MTWIFRQPRSRWPEWTIIPKAYLAAILVANRWRRTIVDFYRPGSRP